MSTSLEPIDFWHMFLRRKWHVIVTFCACVIGGGILCVVLPESYRSQTLILVEGQKIPENYVKAIIGPTIEERLNSLQQQVMSRTVLIKMIEEFGLYPDVVRTNGVDSVIERLRKDIRVTTGARLQRGSIESFSLSFAHENPLVAMKVTEKLASNFIEENLKVREQLVEGASEFIEQELSLAKDRLEAQERAISLFKTKYMGELPEQVQANLSALDRLSLQHSTTFEALQKAADRLSLNEKTIKEYEALGPTTAGTVQGPGGAVVVDSPLLRLKELEKNLTTLASEYKDNYPDIIALKQEIQALKAQIGNMGEKNNESDKTPSLTIKAASPIDTYLRELGRQREESKLEIVSLKERLLRIKDQMKEYDGRVERAPAREQELMFLERDYGNLKENYRSLLDKKLNARVSENLEKRQKGEQFRIVDAANLPQKPESPDRPKIMLIALALGCGLGMGSVVALESFRPVFRRSDEVESFMQLRVLASIPNISSALGHVHKLFTGRAIISGSVETMKGRWLFGRIPNYKRSGADFGTSVGGEAGLPALEKRGHFGRLGTERELDLIAKWSPLSVVAEQFRVAAARLALLQSTAGDRVTVITSAIKGEGKSVVAANLAYVLASNLGKSTLLIDGDLKCPTVHKCMGISQFPGLRDLLKGGCSVDSCFHRVGALPLWILPSGVGSGEMLELSNIHQISSILTELKKKYEYIIIDAPPILPLADMHMLAGMATTLVLVIRAGLTPRGVVQKAIQTIGATGNACIILNGLEAAGVPSYMQDSYKYLSDKKEVGST